MRSTPILLWPIILAAYVLNSFAQVKQTPRLPDQFAEAVLQVEGMI